MLNDDGCRHGEGVEVNHPVTGFVGTIFAVAVTSPSAPAG
jgi:hypothetical protein